MNNEWQLITETIDTSSRDLVTRDNCGWSGWEILQVQPGADGALVL